MNIEQGVKQAFEKIKLNKKEKIIVALSGGKDSTVIAYLLKKLGYNIEGLHVNLGTGRHSANCLNAVKKLCSEFEIPLHVYDLKKEQGKNMKYFWKKNKNLNHCAVCGVFKKWILNREARRLKVDKIATGHNLDDEIETFLLNVFKGSLRLSANTGVITKNQSDKKFIPRIKPLFYFQNDEIKEFAKKNKIPFLEDICPYREDSYRVQIRKFVNELSNEEKNNIMKNFEIISKQLQKQKSDKISYCEICGEPTRGKICKRCQLVT